MSQIQHNDSPPSPALTVAIPTYNRPQELLRLAGELASVGLPADVGLLVVDDGSTDQAALHDLANVSSQIRTLRNSSNLGYAQTFLKVLNETRSHFVLLSADDDVIHFNRLATFASWLKDSQADFVSTQWRRSDGSLYRGKRQTRPIRPEEAFKASRHAPGLCYRTEAARSVLPQLRSALDSGSDAALVYPQVLVALQLVAKGRGWWWAGNVISEGDELESGIRDTKGSWYGEPASRVRQAAAFDAHLTELIGQAESNSERFAFRRSRWAHSHELYASCRQLVGETTSAASLDLSFVRFLVREPLARLVRSARSARDRGR